jgi:hypothetical protein
MSKIDNMISPMKLAAYHLEEAGACLMRREKVDMVGKKLIECGETLEVLSAKVLELSELDNASSSSAAVASTSGHDATASPGKLSAQRMLFASQQMILAGKELTTAVDEKASGSKGKSWIKQGR